MGFNLSLNMNLPVPQVGNEPGPEYAQDVNNCLTLIDQHDHSPGYGLQITPEGININQDFSQNNQNITNIKSARFFSQGSALVGVNDLDCLYVVADDLYYNDGLGNNIRITQNGALAGSPGSIANLVAPASASYSSSQQRFIFQSGANLPAYIDGASIILRNLSIGSNGLTLEPPASMPSDYTITLPSLPASTQPVSISATGVMSAAPITASQIDPTLAVSFVPPGAALPYGGTSAPAGFLMCDGAAVSRTTYSTLFSAIGTAFGSGDGSTTFNVPDMRGFFMRGVSGGSGHDPDAGSRTALNPGGNTGDNVGSYQADEFTSHSHTITSGTAAGGGGQSGLSGPPSANTGSTGGNETRPKNVNWNFIIKT